MATPKKQMITKSNGQVAAYDPARVQRSITRTGVDVVTAKGITERINKNITPGMKTHEIYAMVAKELEVKKPWAAARYDLRKGIVKLGPAGFNFEKYVASVLAAYGYKTQTPETYKGACIEHEIDVTAEKDGRTAFIEAKFRHDFRASINIKDTMATWSRFLDLVDGSNIGTCPHFDEVWIVTNARFTDQSLKWGHCKNMKLIGWNHPEEHSFAEMVDLDSLYPLTVIKQITDEELQKFAAADLMLCRELLEIEAREIVKRTGISLKKIESLIPICEQIVHGDNA